jgi:hypothetical protein
MAIPADEAPPTQEKLLSGLRWFSRLWDGFHRTALILVGVLLVAVPTAFTMFPRFAGWPLWVRIALGALWLCVATVVVIFTGVSDEETLRAVRLGNEVAQASEERAKLRDQFQVLLVAGAGGLPPSYQITVYGPSPDARFLVPIYPPALSEADPAIFESGRGAVGQAWESPDETVVVRGEAVAEFAADLTPDQQRRFGAFQLMAATAILDETDVPIGVLSAISLEDDDSFEINVELLNQLADSLAWLIPGAIRWLLLERTWGEPEGSES